MGLFSFNYAKPGPGVDKDAPKKKGIFLYFELLGRKFFKLCQVNMLYFLCSIPYIALMFLFITGFFGGYFTEMIQSINMPGEEISGESVSTILLMLTSLLTMLFFALWGSGPASASFAYVTRCFTREEHSWIWSDFIRIFKENFKQAMIVVVMDFVMLFLMLNALIQYWNLYTTQNQFVFALLMYLCFMMFIIYTFMHFHIYQLMITFECKFRDLLKNALMLAFGKAPMNLVLGALAIALLGVMFNYLQPVFALLLCFLVFLGLVRYPIEFYSARTIQRIAIEFKEDK
ncbi:MAG: DUF624 domain-containing protein [Clostridia bacterium]|nr:DUF624 domain-containing protein [Clostridia bacterium]